MKKTIALVRPGIHQTDVDFVKALNKAGHISYLLIPDYANTSNLSIEGINLVRYKTLNFKFYKSFPIPLNLKRILKGINPDIVQPNEDFQIYTWVCSRYSSKNNKKLCLISEKYTYPDMLNKLIIKLIDLIGLSKKVWQNTHLIISHGSETTLFLKDRGCKKRIIELPIGVDASKFPQKRDYKFSDKLKIVTIARFIPHKALDVLLKSLNKNDKVHLTIVGNGPLQNKIKNLIKLRRLEDQVRIIDFVRHDDLWKIFHKNDIYVCSSRREVASTTIPEAMSCGLPVIVTDAGSSKDFIKDGHNGFIFKSEHYKDLREKIRRFLKNPKLIKKMGRKSRVIAMRRLDWKILIGSYIKLINA